MTDGVYDGWVNVFRSGSREGPPPSESLSSAADYFGGNSADQWTAATSEDLLAAMDEAGVTRGLLNVNPTSVVGKMVGIDLEEGIELCSAAPGRLALAIRPQEVTKPMEMARNMERAITQTDVRCLRIFPAMLDCSPLDRRLYPLYAVCNEAQLAVSVNVGICGPRISSRYQHPEMLEDLLVEFPDLTVIAAHMGHPWERLLMRLMMKFESLFLMTSAYSPKYFDPELVRFMSSRRGLDRVIFASDWPILPLSKVVAEARALPLTEPAMGNFLRKNLARALHWS